MFTKFRVQNFRTHLDTEINLKDLTLIIGSNNSGKTNLLEALSFFSKILHDVKITKEFEIDSGVFLESQHTLSKGDVPISFASKWENNILIIDYEINLIYEGFMDINVTEKLTIQHYGKKYFFDNSDEKNSSIFNKLFINKSSISIEEMRGLIGFSFNIISNFCYFHFQPIFLKNIILNDTFFLDNQFLKYNYADSGLPTDIAFTLGKEGLNFQELIKYVRNKEGDVYNKFVGLLKRFEDSFNGIHIVNNTVYWQFDLGNSNFPYFSADKISDGLLKASALALICAMDYPPNIIMIEEIENGINQKNIKKLLDWLSMASEHGNKTQFIITSHSPSVIREFADKLDSVYNVHLKKKKGYVSDVSNLNEGLKVLAKHGAINEETYTEVDGVIHLRPYALTELFYNGILGEL
jgi:predicted ATPase